MAIKTGVGSPIKITIASQEVGTLTVTDDKSAAMVYCYGGIDVGDKKSGEYMYDYFNKTGKNYNLFVAYDAKVSGPDTYKTVKSKLDELSITPKYNILYIFSGGHGPTRKLLSSVGAGPFDKIYIVDIWMGGEETATFWKDFVKNNSSKVEYYYSTGGATNNVARDFLKDNASKALLNIKGHMFTNIDAISALMEAYKPPFSQDPPPPPPPPPAPEKEKVDPPGASASNAKSIDPKSTSSKITLVKKSGPGELKGVVEKEIADGFVEFSGLQVDKGGTYIIEAIPSNPDLEKTEFTIIVQEEPEQIEQTKQPEEEKKDTGNRPIIAQIDEPNVNLSPMKRDISPNVDEAIEGAASIGIKPVLYYNGAEIASHQNIKSMTLYYENNLPKCKVTFRDSSGLLTNQPPRDDSKFEVFMNSSDVDIKSIHIGFKITNQKKLGSGGWYFEGSIDVDDLYVLSSKSYDGTSFEVLRKISKEMNLGFNSNIENTDDKMKWINTNLENKDFMKQIIEHAYKDEKSFMYGYVDYYYSFNYVDIEKEWSRPTSGDFMVETGGTAKLGKKSDDKFVPLLLTNEPSQNSSTGYYRNFKITNQSTENKLKKGYRTIVRYYDEQSKSILEFEVDSQSTDDGRNIILKGEQGSNAFLDKKVNTKFLGKFDSENLHKNYLYAKEQNRINLDNLASIACTITLPNPNFNLYRLQKVNLLFYIVGQTPNQPNQQDYRYSGDWIIIDINFDYSSGKKGFNLNQNLTLVRKELGKNPEELKESEPAKTEPKEGNKNENTEQPSTEEKPNQKYKVGQKVKVIKNDGTKYEIEITKILENGIEVEGKIRNI